MSYMKHLNFILQAVGVTEDVKQRTGRMRFMVLKNNFGRNVDKGLEEKLGVE